MTPAEVLKYAEKNGAKFVDFKFVDLLGIWQHTTMPIAQARRRTRSPRASASTAARFAAGRPSTSPTWCSCRTPTTAVMDPFYAQPTLSLICDIVDAVTRQPYSRDPRYIATQGRAVPEADRPRRHRLLRPRARVLHLRRACASPRARTPRSTRSTPPRAAGTRAARKTARTSATSRRSRAATSRCRPSTP